MDVRRGWGIGSILLVIAAVCFGLAAFGVGVGSVALVPLGLMFLALGLVL